MRATLGALLLGGCIFISADDRQARDELLANATDTGLGDDDDTGTGVGDDDDDDVVQLEETWLAVSVGAFVTCAIETDHTVRCWADPPYDVADFQPVVPSGLDFVGVSVGTAYGCAWDATGTTRCFGDGDGSTNNPADGILASPGVYDQVDCGGATCCGISGGDVSCWGTDYDTEFSYKALDVDQVSVGSGACARASDDTVDCWTFTSTGGADPAAAWSQVDDLDVGAVHTCASLDGVLGCWQSQGTGTVTTLDAPPATEMIDLVAQDNAGLPYACGLVGGEVRCYGTADFEAPTISPPPGPWEQLAFDRYADVACVIDAGGVMTCWGEGGHRPQ